MKVLFAILGIVCACHAQAQTTKEQEYLADTMIPLAREFFARNALPFDRNMGSNSIRQWNIDFWTNKAGSGGFLKLTNGWFFYYLSDGTNTEIIDFHTDTKTDYHNPAAMPKGELEAVKALNLRNKLTKEKALEIAKWHFRVMGHNEKDFHPPEFFQLGGEPSMPDYFPVPYYKAIWYRKDVNIQADSAAGKLIPQVDITVSGVTTNIIEYGKAFMPAGHDF